MVNSTVDHDELPRLNVGIVGLGSRGLSVLERIVSLSRHLRGRRLRICIFEPNEPGTGIHQTNQPDYLLLNTIAHQITMFPDRAAITDETEERLGPNLYEWCRGQGIRIGRDGLPSKGDGRPVAPTDFLPRRVLGEYLTWFYREVTSALPTNVKIVYYRQPVLSISHDKSTDRFTIKTTAGNVEDVGKVFVTIGHTTRPRRKSVGDRRVDVPYPLPGVLEDVSAQDVVGVEGLGLAAMDVLAALTLGRGGQFERDESGRARYEASGREPRIVVFSRSGLPFRVRPDTDTTRQRHRPVFLGYEVLSRLRARVLGGQLDFERDLMPRMCDEMRAAFYVTCARRDGDGEAESIVELLTSAGKTDRVAEVFSVFAARFGSFEPNDYLLTSLPAFVTAGEYPQWVRSQVEIDLDEARLGVSASPVKAALEVWRDLRDVLRAAVDFGGLTPDSNDRFFKHYSGLINRLVAGPQKERHQDLLALLDAGIVEIARGRGSRPVWRDDIRKFEPAFMGGIDTTLRFDWHIVAHIGESGLTYASQGPLAQLVAAGKVRPVDPERGMHGVAIDERNHPRDQNDRRVSGLWVLGPVVEGSTYYNHYVPSGGAYSRALSDAHIAVSECFGLLDRNEITQGAEA